MKTTDQIVVEVKKNDFLKNETIDESSIHVKNAIDFYQKFPQYEALEANAVYFLRAVSKKSPIWVHQFTNGSIWFVGDFGNAKNTPIASIGDWIGVNGWATDLKDSSTIIDTLTHASFIK
jgi:hypothetical protein